MKKYLSNTLVVIIALLILAFGPKVTATNSIKYYEHYLRSLGLEVDVAQQISETPESTVSVRYALPDKEEDLLLIKASQLHNMDIDLSLDLVDKLRSYRETLVVCDTTVRLLQEIECGYDHLTYPSELQGKNTYKFDLDSDINPGIFSYYDAEIKLILIPEMYLVDAKRRDELSSFLTSLSRSRYVGPETSKAVFGSAGSETYQIGALVRVLAFALPPLFFVVVARRFLRRILSSPSVVLDKNYRNEVSRKLVAFYQSLYSLFIFATTMLGLVLTGSAMMLSLKENQRISLGYIAQKFIDGSKITNLTASLQNESYVNISMFLLIYLFLFSLGYVLIPGAIYFLRRSFELIKSRQVRNENFGKIISILLVSLVSAIVIAPNRDLGRPILLALVLLLCYFAYLARVQKIKFKKVLLENFLQNKNSITSVLVVLFFLLLLGVARSGYSSKLSNLTSKESLISVSDKIVTLPYSKSFSADAFNDFFVNSEFPIFVNNILVYHPGFDVINNLPAREFKPQENTMLIAFRGKGFIGALTKNQIPLDYVKSERISKYLLIPSLNAGDAAGLKYYMEFGFDCNTSPSPKDVKLILYSESGEKSSDVTLIKFPGCSETGDREVFSVFIKDPQTMASSKLVEVNDFDALQLKDMRLYAVPNSDSNSINESRMEIDVPLIFIKDPNMEPVLWENLSGSSRVLNVYSFGLSNSFEFDIGAEERTNESTIETNISPFLNMLIESKALEREFILWSTWPDAVIRNDY